MDGETSLIKISNLPGRLLVRGLLRKFVKEKLGPDAALDFDGVTLTVQNDGKIGLVIKELVVSTTTKDVEKLLNG